MGDLGQIIPCEIDLRNKDSLRGAVKHSNVIINLVGQEYLLLSCRFSIFYSLNTLWTLIISYATRFNTMADTHIDAAKRIAEVAAEINADRFIHVSALRVNTESDSEWVRTKREGEKAVKSVFPEVTIIRPATMWGAQDNLINNRASMARYWPVYPVIQGDKKDSYVFVRCYLFP